MSPVMRRLISESRIRQAFNRYRADPPVLDSAGADDSIIEQSLPHSESEAQWGALSLLGIWPIAFERKAERTTMAYAIPQGVRF